MSKMRFDFTNFVPQLIGLHSVEHRWQEWVWTLVEWHWQMETVQKEKSLPLSLCPWGECYQSATAIYSLHNSRLGFDSAYEFSVVDTVSLNDISTHTGCCLFGHSWCQQTCRQVATNILLWRAEGKSSDQETICYMPWGHFAADH
jgi:hypothetical protein